MLDTHGKRRKAHSGLSGCLSVCHDSYGSKPSDIDTDIITHARLPWIDRAFIVIFTASETDGLGATYQTQVCAVFSIGVQLPSVVETTLAEATDSGDGGELLSRVLLGEL